MSGHGDRIILWQVCPELWSIGQFCLRALPGFSRAPAAFAGCYGGMAKSPRKRRLRSEQRRALELLASSPHGATEEMLAYGHGFSRWMLAGLVSTGLAIVQRRVIMAGDTPIEIGKVMITAAGRDALQRGLP